MDKSIATAITNCSDDAESFKSNLDGGVGVDRNRSSSSSSHNYSQPIYLMHSNKSSKPMLNSSTNSIQSLCSSTNSSIIDDESSNLGRNNKTNHRGEVMRKDDEMYNTELDLNDSSLIGRITSQSVKPRGLIRYGRLSLLKIRDDSLVRHQQPKCIYYQRLMSLGIWKNDNPGYASQSHHSGGSGGGGGSGNSNRSGDKNLIDKDRDDQRLSMRNHNDSRGTSLNMNNSGHMERNDSRNRDGHNSMQAKSFSIDHRSMSSSHLMPAFVKRKIVGNSSSQQESPTNNSNSNSNNSSNVSNSGNSSGLENGGNLMRESRVRKDFDVNSLMLSPQRRMGPPSSGGRSSSPGIHSMSDREHRNLDRDRNSSGDQHHTTSLNTSANIRGERRIGSGRIPFARDWEYRSNDKDNGGEQEHRSEYNWDSHYRNAGSNANQSRYENRKSENINNGSSQETNYRQSEKFERRSYGSRNNDFYDSKSMNSDTKTQYSKRVGGCSDGAISGKQHAYNDKISIGNSNPYNNEYGHHRHNNFQGHNRNRNFDNYSMGGSNSRHNNIDEPEWFSSGPTSQHDTIELHGFDDVENDSSAVNEQQQHNIQNNYSNHNKKLKHSNKEALHSKNKNDDNSVDNKKDDMENSSGVGMQTTMTTAGSGRIRKISHSIAKEYGIQEGGETIQTTGNCNNNSENILNIESAKGKHTNSHNNNRNHSVDAMHLKIKNSQENPDADQSNRNEFGEFKDQTMVFEQSDEKHGSQEFNFDVFLNVDPLNNILSSESKPRFSRWFKSIDGGLSSSRSSLQEEMSNIVSESPDDEKYYEQMSPSDNSRQTLLQFLQRGKFNGRNSGHSDLLGNDSTTKNVGGQQQIIQNLTINYNGGGENKQKAISVEELEARMRKTGLSHGQQIPLSGNSIQQMELVNQQKQSMNPAAQKTTNHTAAVDAFNQIFNNSHVPYDPHSVTPIGPSKNESTLATMVSSLQSPQSTKNNSIIGLLTDQTKPQDSEAFKRLLEQITPKHMMGLTNVRNAIQSQQQQQPHINNANTEISQQHAVAHQQVIRNIEEMTQVFMKQQLQNQQQQRQPQQYLQQQNATNNVQKFNQQSTNNSSNNNNSTSGLINRREILKRPDAQALLQGLPSQRIPSPREIQIHTQSIIQNALIRKKLEEQQENFRRRQEMQQPTTQQQQQHQMPKQSQQHNTHHHQQIQHHPQNKQQIGSENFMLDQSQLSQLPSSSSSTSSVSHGPQQHPTNASTTPSQVNSPTPTLAFTPTSVLRKMTAEKENNITPSIANASEGGIGVGITSNRSKIMQNLLMQIPQQQQQQNNSPPNQPRMILGGQQQQHQQHHQAHSLLNQSNSASLISPISPQSICQSIRNQQQQQQQQQNKWNNANANQLNLTKPLGRPILKGPGGPPPSVTNQQQPQSNAAIISQSQMSFASKIEFQQLHQQQQRNKSQLQQQQQPQLHQQQQNILNVNQMQQQHLHHLQEIFQRQQRTGGIIRPQQQHQQQSQTHQVQQPSHIGGHNQTQFGNVANNNTIASKSFRQFYPHMIVGGRQQNDNFSSQNNIPVGQQQQTQQRQQEQIQSDTNTGAGINFQRDGGLSPTSNQLARWFSPELLARASAGKLPSLNMSQALSLEEFERSIQHSSTAVLN